MKFLPIVTIALFALSFSFKASGQQPTAQDSTMFPFVIPWDDATSGTATDVSQMNTAPAGKNGFIVVRDGHFVESATGVRVRFLGTNLAFRADFPSHDDADKVAARMAKYGINLVRLHHMDNSTQGKGGSIWDISVADRQHIDPVQLDRLDYLIAQLKKHGVYVNINLHVSRTFSAADGFPPSISQVTLDFDKRLDEFEPRMIELQKNYARDLLTHVNPYTGLSYANDPCVAVVEINNENSLTGDPAWGPEQLSSLPEPFRGELVQLWNDWLIKKYGSADRLTEAWLPSTTPPGPSILTPNSPWTIEQGGTTQATLTKAAEDNQPQDAAAAVQIAITKTDGTNWHVQAHEAGLSLTNGSTYTVSFRAKADAPRDMGVDVRLDQDDWHNVGLQTTVKVGTDWQTYTLPFAAQDTAPAHNRISFTLGNQLGTVFIDDLRLEPGSRDSVNKLKQQVAAHALDIPSYGIVAEKRDWVAFLADTEKSYADNMRLYLRNTLKIHANVICSQVSYGGLTGLSREASSDFTDNHAYWQHPSFPHRAWDSSDWAIPNTAMVTDLANGGEGTLGGLAAYRVAGKPYTVSEYNHPAPNDYRADTDLVLSTFAAFQDWDAIYLFDYGDYGANTKNDQINSYFSINSDPLKMAFLPAAAVIFRAGAIAPATKVTTLDLPQSALQSSSIRTVWATPNLPHGPYIFSGRLAVNVVHDSPNAPKVAAETTSGQTPPAGPAITVTKNDAGALYRASSDHADVVIGWVGGQDIVLGRSSLHFPKFGNNYAAVALVPMDRLPLATSHRLLLTMAGKAENQDMQWNADRTSVGNHWGHGPVFAEGIPATVTLATSTKKHVWALDPTGQRATEIPATYEGHSVTFTVGPQCRALWYEIADR